MKLYISQCVNTWFNLCTYMYAYSDVSSNRKRHLQNCHVRSLLVNVLVYNSIVYSFVEAFDTWQHVMNRVCFPRASFHIVLHLFYYYNGYNVTLRALAATSTSPTRSTRDRTRLPLQYHFPPLHQAPEGSLFLLRSEMQW